MKISLNIFKEKTKLRERLGNITDPVQREDRLLQIAVEEREEEREKREEEREKAEQRVKDLIEELGGVKKEKVSHNFCVFHSLKR